MRILILSNVFPPGFLGGYELGAFDIARGLVARGHEVRVVTGDYFLDDHAELTDLDVRRVLECLSVSRTRFVAEEERLKDLGGGYLHGRNLRMIASELLQFRPDRILCFNLIGLGPIGILQYLSSLGYSPVVFMMDHVFVSLDHDPYWRKRVERVCGRPAFLPSTHFIFMSRRLCGEVEAALGVPVVHKSFVPGWVEASVLQRPLIAGTTQGETLRFVFASRICDHKGIKLVLNAAQALVEHGQLGFSIDIFGNGEVTDMLVQVSARNLGHHIHYRGCPDKDELTRRFADYDALLFPTWEREPFGFVAAEAAAVGCLPMMTAGIGAAEWFLSDIDSLKISRSAESLAAGMTKLLTMPEARRQQMRHCAKATAGRFFEFARALDSVEATVIAAEPAASKPALSEARRMESAMCILGDLLKAEHHV